MCELAIYRPAGQPTAAYSGLNRPVPILVFDEAQAAQDMAANQRRFNSIIAPIKGARELPAGFPLRQCMDAGNQPPSYCIFVRPGRCAGGSGSFDYNAVLMRPAG